MLSDDFAIERIQRSVKGGEEGIFRVIYPFIYITSKRCGGSFAAEST